MLHSDSTLPPLQITQKMADSWRNIGLLAKFLSIVGLVISTILTIFLLIVFYLSILMQQRSRAMFGEDGDFESAYESGYLLGTFLVFPFFIALVVAVAYWVHRTHLLFAMSIGRALKSYQQADFERAWRHLRNHFRAYGIMLLIFVALTILFFLVKDSLMPPRPY